jgi:hypothetical protein
VAEFADSGHRGGEVSSTAAFILLEVRKTNRAGAQFILELNLFGIAVKCHVQDYVQYAQDLRSGLKHRLRSSKMAFDLTGCHSGTLMSIRIG